MGDNRVGGVQDKAVAGIEQTRGQSLAAPVGRRSLAIYVSKHCSTCAYAYVVAEQIRRDFPEVDVRLVDIHETQEAIPETVFATPTYLLNGRVWSLGNPSPAKVNETFQNNEV